MSPDPDDPEEVLRFTREQPLQPSLLGVSPLGEFRARTDRWKDDLYEQAGIELGLATTSVIQALTDSIGGEDEWGMSTDLDFLSTFELVNRGQPTVGHVHFHLEGRWDYGTRPPEDLASLSLGSLGGTGDTHEDYKPAFIVRNLYWQQGSKDSPARR